MYNLLYLLNILNYRSHFVKTVLFKMRIPYTKTYFNHLYDSNPNRENMYGISKLLSQFGVRTVGMKLNDKNELVKIDRPCIVKYGNHFITLLHCNEESAYYMWNYKKRKLDINYFLSLFDGHVLIPYSIEKTKEINFISNFMIDLYDYFSSKILTVFTILLIIISFVCSPETMYPYIFINTLGIIICYLLLRQDENTEDSVTGKICKLVQNGDCTTILKSNASKVFGRFHLYTIGETYFLSNIIMLSISVKYIGVYAFINTLCIPFTFWSIWYQHEKVGRWCLLCLLTLINIWMIFLFNLYDNSFQFFPLEHIVLYSIIFGVIFILFDYKSLYQTIIDQYKNAVYLNNDFKCNHEIFYFLLYKGKHYEIEDKDTSIIFGNKKAKTKITIVMNPHCNPCAEEFLHIEDLLNLSDDSIAIQFIFLPFSEKYEEHNLWLIYLYHYNEEKNTRKIYKEWFTYGRNNCEKFAQRNKVGVISELERNENNKHKEWIEQNDVHGTPSVFVNGYSLPPKYEIKDLQYII